MEEIKNILPVDNLKTDAAAQTLSKRESGSLIIIFVFVILVLLAFIVYLALNANPQCSEEKKALREDIEKKDTRITQLERGLDYLSSQNKELKDSITKYEFINQFNQTPGEKQIILSPKRRLR